MSRNKSIPNRLKQLQKLVENRSEMLESSLLSLSAEKGASIIFTNGTTKEDRDVLMEHAEELASDAKRSFLAADIITDAKRGQVLQAVTNPEVANIAFIGDGVFGTFNMFDRRSGTQERVTWDALAKAATHLKQGVIEQRTCTEIRDPHKEVRVALGSLIVADQTNIIGTADKTFANHHGYGEFNIQLQSLYPELTNSADQLRRPIGYKAPF
jgi:hypothetical protein